MTTRARLAAEIESAFAEVASFVSTPEMQNVMREISSLPQEKRAQYVLDVLLNAEELKKRGVDVPEGLTVQRSAFRDNRPTLFCVTKYLPPGLDWKKVTVTIDNPSGEPALPYSRFDKLATAP
jgi:hypothetical protein